MSKLLLQCLCLNVTCRMIGYLLLSNNVNFAETVFMWLLRKTKFLLVLIRISQNPLFSLGKNFVGTRHLCEKK